MYLPTLCNNVYIMYLSRVPVDIDYKPVSVFEMFTGQNKVKKKKKLY